MWRATVDEDGHYSFAMPYDAGVSGHTAEAGTATVHDSPRRANATCILEITAKAAPVASICAAARSASEGA